MVVETQCGFVPRATFIYCLPDLWVIVSAFGELSLPLEPSWLLSRSRASATYRPRLNASLSRACFQPISLVSLPTYLFFGTYNYHQLHGLWCLFGTVLHSRLPPSITTMVTTRTSNKHPLTDVSGAGPGTHKRSRKARQASTFNLLGLPIEVRALILRELLLLPEPVEFTSTQYQGITSDVWKEWEASLPPRKLFPEILCTCRQLNNEGDAILYSNTIMWRIGNISDKDAWEEESIYTQPYRGGRIRDLPAILRDKIRSVHIELLVHTAGPSWNVDELTHEAIELGEDFHRSKPKWERLSIQLTHATSAADSVSDYSADAEKIVRRLMYIRNLTSATITGAPDDVSAKMISLMTSD
jgi:hypothetical protein